MVKKWFKLGVVFLLHSLQSYKICVVGIEKIIWVSSFYRNNKMKNGWIEYINFKKPKYKNTFLDGKKILKK